MNRGQISPLSLSPTLELVFRVFYFGMETAVECSQPLWNVAFSQTLRDSSCGSLHSSGCGAEFFSVWMVSFTFDLQ